MRRSKWLAVGVVWLAAFGVRFLYIDQSQASPFFDFPLVDAKTYTDTARQLAVEGQWAGGRAPFWQPPLYPYFLGIIYSLFHPGYYLPRLIQAALGALNCVLLYLLGRRVFSHGLGLIAAGVGAVYGPLVFFEAEFLPPVLAVSLNLGLLLSLLRAAPGRPGSFLVPGVALGLSALCVANILLFSPFLAAWVYLRHGGLPVGQRLAPVGLLVLGSLLAIAPVTLRNYLVGDDLVLISSNAGINFYIGNNAEYEETVRIQPGPGWRALVSRPRTEAGITRASEQSGFFFGKAWEFARNHPLAYIRLQLYKTCLFWHGNEIGRNQDLYYARNYSPLLQPLLWKHGIAFPFGLLAPLALVGIVLACVQGLHRHHDIALLLLFLLSYTLAVVLFFVSSRYRLPVVPILLLFAAYGVRECCALLRERPRSRLSVAVAGLSVLLLAASNFRVGPMDMDGNAETHHRLGFAFEQKGLHANAVAAYNTALAQDPDIQEARYNLASLHAQMGRYDRAIDAYRGFLERFPDRPEARYALGNTYLHARRYPQAISQYQQLLDVDSSVDPADIQGRLAYCYLQIDEPERAARAYRAVLETKPDSLLVRYQLGRLCEARDGLAEARTQYGEVLRRDSTHAEARRRLAYILFLEDEPQAAKTHLKHLVAQDPGDIRARWLLAAQYVVEHRGDEALAQAEAILEIQPDHAQANRLAGHLYVIKGDTLKGVEQLDLFKKLYVEGRQQEIWEVLEERWSKQIEDMFGR